MFTAILTGLKVVSQLLGLADSFAAAIAHHSAVIEGQKVQQLADVTSAQKEDQDAQKIDAAVGDQSRAALIDELRGPSAS